MHLVKFAVISTFILLTVTGCVTNHRPVYSPPNSGQTATIKGGTANIIKFFTAGDSHVAIIEVDGLYIPSNFWTGRAQTVEVYPGLRTITIMLNGDNYTQAQDAIQINAAAGKTYQISATKVGIAFDVIVTESENSKSNNVVVLNRRITGGSSGGPAYIPIMIPIK